MSWIRNQIRWRVEPVLRKLRRGGDGKRLLTQLAGRGNTVVVPQCSDGSCVVMTDDGNSIPVDPGRQKIVWGPDSLENLVRELDSI